MGSVRPLHGGPSEPIPVPELELELEPDKRRDEKRTPVALLTRTAVVTLVLLLAIGASGATVSRIANRDTPPKVIAHLQPVDRQPSTTTSTTDEATTTEQSTTTIPSVVPNSITSRAEPTTTVPAAPGSPNGVIQALGTHLTLDGSIYKFTGVNAYEAATDWGTNAGCGTMLTDAQLDQLFAALPHNSLVRIWAFQGTMATNINTGQLDWQPLDRVFSAAANYGQRIVLVLSGESGGCDGGHWQDLSWYQGGFRDVFNDPSSSNGRGLTPLSYWAYMQAVVNHFKDSPALGMWEPVSEPEASTCPVQDMPINCEGNQICPNETTAALALRYFFDTVGGEIHSLDPTHLVEAGFIGSGQCGTSGDDYQYVGASPGIDVLSYHDYYGPAAEGGDQWNGLEIRFEQAAALNKPIIGGEVGVVAGGAPDCYSTAGRNNLFLQKEGAQMTSGSSGILAWDWEPDTPTSCAYDFGPTDPIMQSAGSVG